MTCIPLLSIVCSAIVGAIFLGTGALKALDAQSFQRQVRRYRLLPERFERPATLLFIACECALGAALILSLSPLLLPVAALLLAGFAILTVWGTRSGRVDDCGCYGGQIVVTPVQSIGLDALYIVLLAVSWFGRGREACPSADWTGPVVAAVFALALIVAAMSLRSPLADLSLLRKGRRWNRRWLGETDMDIPTGSYFIVFLSRDCPWCKRWVPLLNVIEVQPDLPKVAGVMSLTGDALRDFKAEHLIRFPIVTMDASLMSRMADAYPTAVRVENGIVVGKWAGEMPREYIERIEQFYDAVTTPPRQRATFGG